MPSYSLSIGKLSQIGHELKTKLKMITSSSWKVFTLPMRKELLPTGHRFPPHADGLCLQWHDLCTRRSRKALWFFYQPELTSKFQIPRGEKNPQNNTTQSGREGPGSFVSSCWLWLWVGLLTAASGKPLDYFRQTEQATWNVYYYFSLGWL